MNGREKNIDRIFKDKLRHFDAEPPVEAWDSISGKLYLERRRKMIFWFTRVAAGIAVLATLSLSFFIARNTIKDKLISGDKIKVETEIEESVSISGGDSSRVASEGVESELMTEKKEIKEELAASGEPIPSRTSTKQDATVIHEQSQPEQYTGTGDMLATSFQVSGLTFIHGKSIGRLEYNIPGIEIRPSGSGISDKQYQQVEISESKPDEEIYALNIPSEDEKPENRWAIGTQVSPLYSYRNLEIKDESMKRADYYNQAESGTLAYSGGLNVNYSPTRRISVQSGLYYSRYGVSVDQAYFFENTPTADVPSTTKFYSVSNSSGTIDIADNTSVYYITNYGQRNNHNMSSGSYDELSLQVNSGEVIQNFEYIEIPLVLRYRLIDRKIGFNFLGGLSTNLLVSSNTYYNEDGNKEKIGETTDIKPFNYSSIIGIGIDYAISKRFNINLEPTFRYYLNSINESSSIGSHPYSLGVFTGVRYYF
jgi:hypothetical protein